MVYACLSICLPPVTLQDFKCLGVLGTTEAVGMQTTGLSSCCPMCPPAPPIWDPGVVHAASHQARGRVLKLLTGALGQETQLCARVW